MADKDPLKQLKDLTELKSQLEEIHRRVESEVAAGIPQGGSVLGSPFLKGFLAGYVVAKLRSSAFLGVLLGTITGIYAAQNYQVPNIESTIKDYLSTMRKGSNLWKETLEEGPPVGGLLGLMVLIYGSHAPLIALTKVDGQVPFSSSSCVVLIELTKLLVSLASLLMTGNLSAQPASLAIVVPYAVPALLYAFNNNLVVLMQAYMDPSSYQVLSNLKIASTAILYSFCLGKRLLPTQWLALGILMGAGVVHSFSSLDLEDQVVAEAEESPRLHITAWGLLLVLLYCVVSGLAAVYTEMVLKSQRVPLSLQNLYLYVFGVAINGVSYISSRGSEHGFLEGFSGTVWAIVAGQAANGLLMSVVLKHGSGITRLFVISCSMLVNALLSWVFLGLQLHPLFLLPVFMVGLAAYLYYK